MKICCFKIVPNNPAKRRLSVYKNIYTLFILPLRMLTNWLESATVNKYPLNVVVKCIKL